ncbi:MAG: murein biosynthesis integral membrane protein MurJ [Actinobacteria bacterium]|nr:murein biosynthesis integral membrane protein MurJ [Actinomycetota bacterium]
MSSVMRSSALMASGTVVSRLTGVLRDVAAAAALGFYLVADAFSLGNSLPTIIYILVVGGALNAVFVPQLVRRMKDDPDSGQAYADRLLTLVGTVLLALTLVAVIAAPLIVDLYTPADYPEAEFELAVAFARLCLPQILFYGIYTMLSQVLNARGRFGAPMFAPIANNIIAIATFLLFIAVAGTAAAADGDLTSSQVLILGIGTTLGVVLQALILIPILLRSGHVWRLRFDWRDAGLGRAGILAFWTVGLVLVNQATYVVISRLATQANVDATAAGVTAAGLTTYQKAHLVFMLPHSVITVSIVTAMLPALSRLAHNGDLPRVGREIGSTMRLVSAFIIPIAAILMVTGSGLAVLLFGYGAAIPAQAAIMGQIVSVFMIALLPFTLFYVLLRGFYALEDTRTPFFISVAFSLVWLVLAVPLFRIVGSGGPQVASLALAYGVSYWVGMVVAWIILARRVGGVDSKRTIKALLRMSIAGAFALLLMLGTRALLVAYVTGPGSDNKGSVLLTVVTVSAVGSLAYLGASLILRIREVSEMMGVIKRKVLKR